jgi:crossover junction endodeoxyribonuclease RusA
MTITIRLPWPDPILSPNARAHWAKIAKAKKSYRRACWGEAMAKRQAVSGKLTIDLAFIRPTKRAHDADNLVARMKAGIDGIADALGIDDRNFQLGTITIADTTEKGGAVVATIRQP